MIVEIPSNCPVACICEGGAETAIINILLDAGKLIFKSSQLIEDEPLRRTSGKEFCERYLKKDFESKVYVIRVIDSKRENFKITQQYKSKIEQVIDVVTSPEIEMLIIISEGMYDDYKNSNYKKPSEYCKSKLKIKYVKSPSYYQDKFGNDVDFLIKCIKEYSRVHKQDEDKATLYDLIKK